MSSQPIALPTPAHSHHSFALGSYTSPSGAFNPASYTRHFLGSPLSWRGGSFEGRFYPAGSPDHLISSLDQSDFKYGKLSTSFESDRGSIVNAFNVFEGELCRNYSCCGLDLTDLHALIEHFEEAHVVVLDPSALQHPVTSQHQPQPNYDQIQVSQQLHSPNPQLPSQTQSAPPAYAPEQHHGPFDPDDMELDMDTIASTPSSGAPTPPDTPLSTPLSSYPSPCGYMQSHLPQSTFQPSLGMRSLPGSNCASPLPQQSQHVIDSSPIAAFDTTVVHAPSAAHRSNSRAPLSAFPPLRTSVTSAVPDVFNAYAGYSNYSSSMPGTVPSPPASVLEDPSSQGTSRVQSKIGPEKIQSGSEPASPYTGCVPPALLFSDARTSAASMPTASRVSSPTYSTARESNKEASGSVVTARASTTLSRPASSLLLSKPFRCPKANCSKSYKQANGLKYHLTHGSCSPLPPKDVEHVHALIASKRSARGVSESGTASPTSPHSPTATAALGVDAAAEHASIDGSGLGLGLISENELREAEREAERQLRPFACGIGDCQRRYKNMNGLRYHYQHSGDHGAHGLALIASGLHQCLSLTKNSATSAGSTQSSRQASRQGSRERERVRERPSGMSTPVLQQIQPQHPPQYSQQQQQQQQPSYGTYTAQQQAQLTYQQHYAQHQRIQYQQQQQAQVQTQPQPQVSSMGMYMGMDYAMTE